MSGIMLMEFLESSKKRVGEVGQLCWQHWKILCWIQDDRSARCKVVGCELLLLRCWSNSS